MTLEQEILWLSGLLEGEGYFSFAPHRRPRLRIAVQMTDEDVLRRAARIMNTNVLTPHRGVNWKPQWKDLYRTEATGAKAAQIMRQILPFMGIRRKAKIEDCLSRYASRRTHSEAQRQVEARKRNSHKTADLFVVNG